MVGDGWWLVVAAVVVAAVAFIVICCNVLFAIVRCQHSRKEAFVEQQQKCRLQKQKQHYITKKT